MDIDVVLLCTESDLSVCPNTAKLILRSPGLPTENIHVVLLVLVPDGIC